MARRRSWPRSAVGRPGRRCRCSTAAVRAPTLERITVEPTERILAQHAEQQLLVTAHYSDGSTRDVTHLTTFQSNESAIAAVQADGLIQAGPVPGEAAIMARFMQKFAVCN